MKKSKWILVAEDDAPMAELTTLALAPDELACDVIVACDGLEVMDCLFRRGKFQTRTAGDPLFVLLDLKMPKVDGLNVLRQIKSDAQFKSIPVVMFTSSRETSDVRRSYQFGANAYVVKPVDFQKFNEALKRVGSFWVSVNEPPLESVPAKAEVRSPSQMAVAV
jgi:two-component system, response regulator